MTSIPNFDPVVVGNQLAELEADVQSEFAAARRAADNERSAARQTAEIEYVAAKKAARDKYNSRSKDVAELLWSVKENCPDALDAVCKRAGIGRSRKFELLKIGRGDKTIKQSREEDAERQKKSKAKKKADAKAAKGATKKRSVTEDVTDSDEEPTEEPGDEGTTEQQAEQQAEETAEEQATEQATEEATEETPTSAERLTLLASSLCSWFPDDVADALMARDRSYAVALANAILARSPSPPPPVLADDGLPEIVTTEDLAARRAEEEARLELPANLRRTVEPALEQVEHIADAKVEVLEPEASAPEASAPAKSKRKSRSKNTAPVTPDPAEPHPTIQ